MIKKYLFGIGISFFGLLGSFFVKADEYGSFDGDIPMSFYMSDYNNIVNDGLSFESVGSDLVSNKRLFLKFSNSEYKSVFWNDGKLYWYNNTNGYHYQGYINKFCKIYSEDGGIGQICSDNRLNISEFYSLNDPNFTRFWIYPAGGITNFCVYDNISKYYYCFGVQDLTGNLNIPENSIDYSDYAEDSPYLSGQGIGTDVSYGTGESTVIPSDIDNYISYYEDNFGFNETMCYVGTDDLDSVYGTNGVEFEYGSGATIYGLYYHIYSGFGSNKIHNVGSFVNVWLLDYASWFKTVSDERLYMAQYNGPDQNVTYIYSGFTFPFENKPVAIYFMADLLSEEYITESSQGENIVFYCDMKLNYDNYKNGSLNFSDIEDLVDDKIKERAKDYINRNIKGSDGYSVPELGSGSIWDGLVQSGYNIPKDLNPTNLFKDFYTKIDGLFKNFRGNPIGIIPTWILYPMLFLILFRMLRH